jgi:O-methyltransferase domain
MGSLRKRSSPGTALNLPLRGQSGKTVSSIGLWRMIFDDPEKSIPTLLSDLNMLVLTGGQERTEEEYARLFASAGLRLTSVVPVAYPYGVCEGAPN